MRRVASLGAVVALVFGVIAIAPGKAAAAYIGPWSEYGGHYYTQVDGIDWQTAEQYAVNHGGHLVTINNQAEQDFLATTFTDPDLSIGYYRTTPNGDDWVWTSEQTPGYENWADGEPNNSDGVEHVAVMNAWGTTDKWNDVEDNYSAIIEVPSPYAGNDAWDEPNYVDETFDDSPDMAVASFQDEEPMPCVSEAAEGSVWYWFWNPGVMDIRIEIDGDDGDVTAAIYRLDSWPTAITDLQGMEYSPEQGPCTWDTGPNAAWMDSLTRGLYFIQLTSSHGPWLTEDPSIHVQRNWAPAWFTIDSETVQVTGASVGRDGYITFNGTAECVLQTSSPDPEGGYPEAWFNWTSEYDGYYAYDVDAYATQPLGRKTLLEGGNRGTIDCTTTDAQGRNPWWVTVRSDNGKFGPNWTNLDVGFGGDTCNEGGCYFYGFGYTHDYVKVIKAR
jgi:hypothetical protein